MLHEGQARFVTTCFQDFKQDDSIEIYQRPLRVCEQGARPVG